MTIEPASPTRTAASRATCARPGEAIPARTYRRLSRASIALTAAILMGSLSPSAQAGPWAEPGDPGLRHDLQLLVDHGVMNIPLTTWPLSYPDIYAGLKSVDVDAPRPPHIRNALLRVKGRLDKAADGRLRASVELGGNTDPEAFRGFADTPRGDAELAVSAEGGNDRVAFKLKMTTVMNAVDDKAVRFDDSHLSVLLGNWVISLAAVDRWWGPGWDGSLILSNNARPVPSLVLQRNKSTPFETPLLSWLGPWQLTTFMGQLEHDRAVPDALLWGMRFNFRPLPGLEIGLSRTAQWCGDGRPCDLSTFGDLLLGFDNRGDDELTAATEPGNQLAGFDLRWAATSLKLPAAIYGQLIGEDEADGWPSKYLGLGGIEAWGGWRDSGASWRGFFELAYTTADLISERDYYNVAYNHGIYKSGYRYRDVSMGHGADNDSLVYTLGFLLNDQREHGWMLTGRYAEFNRDDAGLNTFSPRFQKYAAVDLRHERPLYKGLVTVDLGLHHSELVADGSTDTDPTLALRWQRDF